MSEHAAEPVPTEHNAEAQAAHSEMLQHLSSGDDREAMRALGRFERAAGVSTTAVPPPAPATPAEPTPARLAEIKAAVQEGRAAAETVSTARQYLRLVIAEPERNPDLAANIRSLGDPDTISDENVLAFAGLRETENQRIDREAEERQNDPQQQRLRALSTTINGWFSMTDEERIEAASGLRIDPAELDARAWAAHGMERPTPLDYEHHGGRV